MRSPRRATTLVETLIGISLTGLIAVGATAMVITVTKQTRVNFAHEMARRQAGHALDFMAAHLRSASVDQPLQFDPAREIAPGVYEAVRLRERDAAGRWRWAEFRLGDDGEVIYDPDVDAAGDEQTIARGSSVLPRFTDLRFIQNLDQSMVEDNTALSIQLTVSDGGETRTWFAGPREVALTMTTFLALRAPGR
jgi:hypothetical protein